VSHHCGAAHSCSSIADLVLKNIQRFKEKLALNRCMDFFLVGSAKLEEDEHVVEHLGGHDAAAADEHAGRCAAIPPAYERRE
jgi:hypothetical protein